MSEDKNLIDARHLERINRCTSIDTGIYVEGELIRFHETKLFNKEIGIILPALFEDMEPDEARKKYFSEQRPQIIKTNEDGSVNFSFSMVDKKVDAVQLKDVIQDFHHVLKRFQPMSVCLEMGEELNDSIPNAWMEFISNALNDNLYNMLTIYPIGERLLMTMFNCPFQKHMEWTRCLSPIRKSIVLYNSEGGIDTKAKKADLWTMNY